MVTFLKSLNNQRGIALIHTSFLVAAMALGAASMYRYSINTGTNLLKTELRNEARRLGQIVASHGGVPELCATSFTLPADTNYPNQVGPAGDENTFPVNFVANIK